MVDKNAPKPTFGSGNRGVLGDAHSRRRKLRPGGLLLSLGEELIRRRLHRAHRGRVIGRRSAVFTLTAQKVGIGNDLTLGQSPRSSGQTRVNFDDLGVHRDDFVGRVVDDVAPIVRMWMVVVMMMMASCGSTSGDVAGRRVDLREVN